MSYYNQNNYADIPYPHATRPTATVKSSGCGVCCASMIVEELTGCKFPPQDSAAWSINNGCRASGGTDMAKLARLLGCKFNLEVFVTSTLERLVEAVRGGAKAIVNVGGDYTGHIGLFSNGGHYIVVCGAAADKLIVWDPGYYVGKFSKAGRKDMVTISGYDIYVAPQILHADCATRTPRYYIFTEADMTQEQFNAMMDVYLAEKQKLPASQWAMEEIQRAVDMGITDGTSPRGLATREEVIAMISRGMDKRE